MRTIRAARPTLALAISCALCAGGVGAFVSHQTHVLNSVRTGTVDVAIVDAGHGLDAAPLVTNQSVSHPVTLKATGDECWLRVGVTRSVEGAPFGECSWRAGAADAALGEGWVLAQDGYWYLTVPLPAGESIGFTELVTLPVFEQVSGPDGYAWGPLSGQEDPVLWTTPSPDPGDDPSLMAYSTGEGAALRSTITVEALQAEAVSPDFASESPWGGVTAWPAIYTYDVGA